MMEEGWLKKWHDVFQSGKYEDALKISSNAAESNPRDPDTYYYWGLTYAKMGNFSEAIEKFNQAIDIDPKYVNAYRSWGHALTNLKKYDEAIEKLQKALKINEELGDMQGVATSYNNIGLVHQNLGKLEYALEHYLKALKINEELGDMQGVATSYNNIGLVHQNLGKLEYALEHYQKALEINEKLGDMQGVATSYNNIGLVYQDLGKLEEALEYYQKAIENDHYAYYPYYNKGKTLSALKRYDEAIEAYDKALEINPENTEVRNERELVLSKIGSQKVSTQKPSEKFDMESLQLSPSVTSVANELHGEVSASAIVNGLLERHGKEYGGEGIFEKFRVEETPYKKSVREWLTEVRSLYKTAEQISVEQTTVQKGRSGELHAKLVIVGLSLLDGDLAKQFFANDFLSILVNEIKEPIDSILTSKGQEKWHDLQRLMAIQPDTVPTHPDEPAKVDQLQREPFAKALAKRLRRIRFENMKSSISGAFLLHIHGPWGSGKTSLLNFIGTCLSDPDYLFSWDEIPGNDSDKLIEFLLQNFGVAWVRRAKIEKIDNGKTINVTTENNSFSLRLNDGKNKVILTFNNIKINEFIVKIEKGKINIFNSQWIVVDFNAWQNQRIGPPWWSMMDAVYRAGIQQMVSRKRIFNLWTREYKWRLTTGRLHYYLAFALFVWALAIFVRIIFPESNDNAQFMPNIKLYAETISTVIALLVTVLGIIIGITQSLLPGSARAARTFMESTNDPLQHLSHHFEDLVKWIEQPVVIFIDDLDRCQLEYTIDLLEGIQTLFRKTPVMYVVAADRRWLCTSYEKVYDVFTGKVQEPGRPLGYLFLEKTFQLSVSLPRLSPDVQKRYWQHLIRIEKSGNSEEENKARKEAKQRLKQLQKEEDILAEISITKKNPIYEQAFREEAVIRLATPEVEEHKEHTLKIFAPLLEPNPRAMKRLINAYSVQRDIVLLSGGDIELKKLALWTILSMRWPLLAEYLQDHPEMIKYIGGKETLPIEKIPKDLQELFQDPNVVEVIKGKKDDLIVGTLLDKDTICTFAGLRTANSKTGTVA